MAQTWLAFVIHHAQCFRYTLAVQWVAGAGQGGGAQGQATDIEIQAREILNLRRRLNEIYVRHTGQPVEAIETALERDKFMNPDEAKSFGLIDEVVTERPPRPDEAKAA